MKKTMFKRVRIILMTFVLGIMMITPATAMAAELPINFGDAESFAVLAGSTITNTGPTTIEGDVGLYAGTSVTGFDSVTLVGGTLHKTDAVAMEAKAALSIAYIEAAGRTTTPVIGTITADLGGSTLTPGVYTSATSIGLTGTLILDGQNDPNAVFIFQAGSTLTTAANSQILLINGASASNVFWQVGSSATLGTNSIFAGDIMAQVSITLTTGAKIDGKVMALTGAVTLDSNVIGNIDYNMSIVKTADAVTVEVGDTVTYTITITNMGLEPLTDISVIDTMIGLNTSIVSLAAGSSSIFTGSYVAQTLGALTNTASASDDQAPNVTDSVTVTVVSDIVTPEPTTYRMSIVKTADATEVEC
ncbi:MAG: DUF3494 domain-containing protein [Dethiosulfatibacter sp.]|nr:DUF3494 domain-containing protein [Dethiosulfatibacter sp.]